MGGISLQSFALAMTGLLFLQCTAADSAFPSEDKQDDPFSVRYLESQDEVTDLLELVVDQSFPELSDESITSVGKLGKATMFFWAQPHWGSIANPFASTRYRVFFNTLLFESSNSSIPPLPYKAAEAILAHELSHVSDYATTATGLLRTGWTQVVHGTAEARNERRTDLSAIRRGYAEGLKTYRRWIYSTLEGEALRIKKATYFSPDEITMVNWAIGQYPQLIAYWRKSPPLSLAAIKADIALLDADVALPQFTGCDDDQFSCFDQACIESFQLCDGTAQCSAGEDESVGCNTDCPADMFICGSGECIPASYRCDSDADCFDFSDEAACEF